MANKKAPDPSVPSSAARTMAPRIELSNTLMGGTAALRLAGEKYLPKFRAESTENYNDRLKRSKLVNYFKRSVESLVGKPFSKPITINDDMPPELVALCENVDHNGNDLNAFARKSFQDAMLKSFTCILVDYPVVDPEDVQNLAQERAINASPYFVHIPPENIIAAYYENEGGKEVLTQVRLWEVETSVVDFTEVSTRRIRILYPGRWELWRQKDDEPKNEWYKETEGVTTLKYIPLVTIYFDREDFMVGLPPLTDLAYLNLAHWQSGSDQTNILTVARFPIIAASGLNDEEANAVEIGPKKILSSVNPDGKFYYLEHTGAAIEAGRKDLEDMKSEMSILGIELLSRSGNATATAKAIDTAENLSMLQAFALLFADGMNQAFQYAADWLTLKESGTVAINTDFGLSLNNAADVPALQAARASRDISRVAYLNELKRRQVLSGEYDPEADKVLLDEESVQIQADAAWQKKLETDGLVNPKTPDPNKGQQPPIQ